MAFTRDSMIETAALGRPFQLGMLYDCRNDEIVPGITLWDREQLQQNTAVCPHINTEFTVTSSDTIKEKSKHLKVDGELKLSLLGGNIMLSGAARYFNDTKKSYIQERLTLHYRTNTRFEQLTMNHLAKGKTGHQEVFDYNIATHVVTAVLYGADAYFVFDREVNLSEDTKHVQGEVTIALEKLKILCSAGAQVALNLKENEKAAVKQLSCTFYGDFKLPSNPTTFEDAVKVYTDLPKLLGENGEHAVPVKVWLFPLVKLDSRAAKLQRNISTDLIRAVESIIEALNVTEMKCGDLLQDIVAKSFSMFYSQVQTFQKFCFEYKQDFMKYLGCVLPEIRGGKTDIKALNEILEAHEKSPFNACDLQQWITVIERKNTHIKALLKQLCEIGAEVDDDIDKYLLDLNVENLVAYAFSCVQQPDPLLTKQETYLNHPMMLRSSENTLDSDFQKKLSTSDDLMCMKNNLKMFKNLITSNQSKSTRFIVQSLPQTSNYSSSCILVYENGCVEAKVFVPPSKPACPVIESVTDTKIRVKLSSTCAATLERKLLYKIKQEDNWKSQPVHQDTVTITNFKEGTNYEIKCGAVGKLDYMVESDAVPFTTHKSTLHTIDRKCFVYRTGNTLDSHKTFIDRLKKPIHLQEVSKVNECDFILVFCPVVSRAGTDIETAIKMLQNVPDTKPALLVVLHHRFDPDCVVPDSRRAVRRKNVVTVDCLFHKDMGLLQCSKNNESLSTASEFIKSQGIFQFFMLKNEEPNRKCFGQTLGSQQTFMDRLKERIRLQEVSTVNECDFILVFCPIVSRTGTDIEAAIKKLLNISDTKPALLVVLHHIFDPDCVVPDSRRAVRRKNVVTVDCLFHEDMGLLQCSKNNESLSTASEFIKSQVLVLF